MSQAARETRHRDTGLLRQMRDGLDEIKRTIDREALERRRLERVIKRQAKIVDTHSRRILELEKELRIWTTEEVPTLDPEESWG